MSPNIPTAVESSILADLESAQVELKAVNDQNDYNDNEVGTITRTLKLKEAKSEFDGLYEDLESSMNVLEKLKVIEQALIRKLDEVQAERANVPSRLLQ